MDKKLFVVAVAVGASLLGTLIPLFMMRGQERPAVSQAVLWALLGAGVVAFLAVMAVVIARGG